MTRGVATFKEVRTFYDIVDLLDVNEALDLIDEAEHRAVEKARTKG